MQLTGNNAVITRNVNGARNLTPFYIFRYNVRLERKMTDILADLAAVQCGSMSPKYVRLLSSEARIPTALMVSELCDVHEFRSFWMIVCHCIIAVY